MSTNNQISPLQFCCNTSIPFLNNPKDLDPSYKMDLDFWDCFGREKNTVLKAKKYGNNQNEFSYDVSVIVLWDNYFTG